MKKCVSALLLSLFVAAMIQAGEKPKDFATAKAFAKDQSKPLLIDFFADWCGPCKRFDRAAKRDRDVKAELAKVVLFKIDAEKGEGVALARKYNVSGYPTFVLADQQGNVIDRWSGYGKDYFIDSLQVGMSDLSTIDTKMAEYQTKKSSLAASSLARYFEAREEFEKALGYYEDAQSWNKDPQRDYLYPIFDIRYSQLQQGVGSFDKLRAASDRLVASNSLDDGTKLMVMRRVAGVARKMGEAEAHKKYIETAMDMSRGGEGFMADTYGELEIEHALFIKKDKTKAVTLKKSRMPEGWESNPEQLNAFAWWCYENTVNMQEAEGFAQKAIDMMKPGSERAMVIDTLAELVASRGDHQGAVKLIKQAIDEHPGREYYEKQLARFEKMLTGNAG